MFVRILSEGKFWVVTSIKSTAAVPSNALSGRHPCSDITLKCWVLSKMNYYKWEHYFDVMQFRETSGRLHPLWPQNKWLHTPRTTDYRHTRQDRWIQTELAFTLAKNATKPNTFEIIPLQTTRKENNWKTEEALARAAVTLETERIKGSNPWCLWWWWETLLC